LVLLGLFYLNRAMLVELYVDELIATISFRTPSLYVRSDLNVKHRAPDKMRTSVNTL
jgi:hypothetical protein